MSPQQAVVDTLWLRRAATTAHLPWEAVWEEADGWWAIYGAPFDQYVCPQVATLDLPRGDMTATFLVAAINALPSLLDLRTLHVLPLGDIVDHAENPDCICGPIGRSEEDGSAVAGCIYVHHSLDGREAVE